MKLIKIFKKIGNLTLKQSGQYDVVLKEKDGTEHIVKDFKIDTKEKKGIIYIEK